MKGARFQGAGRARKNISNWRQKASPASFPASPRESALDGPIFPATRAVALLGSIDRHRRPSFLHGVYSSATRTKGMFGRMQSCGYMVHNAWCQNLPPLPMPFYRQPKEYLFSFIGRRSHPVRKKLFRASWPCKEVFIADTTGQYEHFKNQYQNKDQLQNRQAMQARYWEIMARSKFVLCPRGAGASSIRLFEAMQAGVAPVISSDDWIPAAGPDR